MKLLKISKTGIISASLYLLLTMTVFVSHLYSVKTNAGDSGESAIPLFLLALPWIMLIPSAWMQSAVWAWLAYPVLWGCIGINAVLLYCLGALTAFIMQWLANKTLMAVRNVKKAKQ